MLIIQIVIQLSMLITAGPTIGILGSWSSCSGENAEYIEWHFREDYIEICHEWSPGGMSALYNLKSDTLTYILPGGEVVKSKIQFLSDSVMILLPDFDNIVIELHKLDKNYSVPSASEDEDVIDAYEEAFALRVLERNCTR